MNVVEWIAEPLTVDAVGGSFVSVRLCEALYRVRTLSVGDRCSVRVLSVLWPLCGFVCGAIYGLAMREIEYGPRAVKNALTIAEIEAARSQRMNDIENSGDENREHPEQILENNNE